MVKLYKQDISEVRKVLVAEFNTPTEARLYIETHPEQFTDSIPTVIP